jgi:hydroxymethylglutaryl-CoA lyase
MHFHDTTGLAIANIAMSYQLGIRNFDAATGGLGGCPFANSKKGNVAMEDIVRWCNAQNIPCAISDLAALENTGAAMRNALENSARGAL